MEQATAEKLQSIMWVQINVTVLDRIIAKLRTQFSQPNTGWTLCPSQIFLPKIFLKIKIKCPIFKFNYWNVPMHGWNWPNYAPTCMHVLSKWATRHYTAENQKTLKLHRDILAMILSNSHSYLDSHDKSWLFSCCVVDVPNSIGRYQLRSICIHNTIAMIMCILLEDIQRLKVIWL